jgi:hypothetical protein
LKYEDVGGGGGGGARKAYFGLAAAAAVIFRNTNRRNIKQPNIKLTGMLTWI